MSQKASLEKRQFLDFLRGFAIFLMLWGHSIQYCCGGQFDFFENSVFKIIYSFHMPFFMLISGYLFFFSAEKRETNELIEYKTKSLLYPILMCSIFNFIVTNLISTVFSLSVIKNYPFGGTPITSLWFLWSVLACSLALSIAVKPVKNKALQIFIIVLGIGLVAILPCGEMNVYMYPYFVIGYVYAKNEEYLKKVRNIFSAFSCAIFVVMIFFFEKKHYIYTSGLLGAKTGVECLKIDFFRWAIGLFGSIATIFVCRCVYKLISKSKISIGIELLGQNSLAVYALSVSLLSYWLPKLSNKALALFSIIDWNNYIWFFNLITTPLVAAIYSVALLLIINLLKKMKLHRLIFGR